MRLSQTFPIAMLLAGSIARTALGDGIPVTPDMFPLTITNPGIYRLTGNVVISNAAVNGIVVQCDNVTIDLAEYELSGSGAGSGNGIFQRAGLNKLTVSNGIVRNWSGAPGTNATDAGCGILALGTRTDVRDMTVSECAQGIRLGPLSRTIDSTFYSNRLQGACIDRGGLANLSTAFGNGTGFECGEDGVVEFCTAHGNVGAGFLAKEGASLSACTANGNGTGIVCGTDCEIINSSAAGSTSDGIVMDRACVARACTASENGRHGFTMGTSCESDGNTARGNADKGILATGSGNKIMDCKTMGNRIGIAVEKSGNIVEANASGQNRDANFSVAAGNNFESTPVHLDAAPDASNATNLAPDRAVESPK